MFLNKDVAIMAITEIRRIYSTEVWPLSFKYSLNILYFITVVQSPKGRNTSP